MYASGTGDHPRDNLPEHRRVEAERETEGSSSGDRNGQGGEVPPQEEQEAEGQEAQPVTQQPGHVVWILEHWGWDGRKHYSIGIE